MKRLLTIVALLGLLFGPADAKRLETLKLKNGSIYSGYVKEQTPGSEILFVAEQGEIIISESELMGEPITEEYRLSKLPKPWQHWAEENSRYVINRKGSKYLKLATIELPDSTIRYARIIERDNGKTLKFHRLYSTSSKDKTINIKWNDIEYIQYEPHDQNQLNAVCDEIRLKNGTIIRGEIIEKKLGESYQILDEQGVKRSVHLKDIDLLSKYGLNPEVSLFEQSEMLDVIELNSSDRPKRGIIVEQGTEQGKGGYMTLLMKHERSERISTKDINKLKREKNRDYIEESEVIIEDPDTVVVNGTIIRPIKTNYDPEKEMFSFTKNDTSIVFNTDSDIFKLRVEMLDADPNENVFLISPNKVAQDSKKRKNQKPTYDYMFTYKTLVKTSRHCSQRIVRDVIRREYDLTKGKYVLYRDDKVYVIDIK